MHDAYEQQVREEIAAWKNEKDGAITHAIRRAGKIVQPVTGVMMAAVPNSVKSTVMDAVLGALEAMNDAAYWTYRDADVLRVARSEGAEATCIEDLAKNDMKALDCSARRFFMSNKLIAMLEGAGCGLGGWAFVAADVPALFTVSFRAVQQIGSCYGVDMRDPQMVHVVMRVFNAGSATAPEVKAAALFDMHVASIAMAKKWTYQKTAEKTQTGVMIKALKEATKHMPRQISRHVTKRKLAQGIPFVGAGVGGFFNYRFLSNTCRSAHMLFRELYLTRKYGDEGISVEYEPVALA